MTVSLYDSNISSMLRFPVRRGFSSLGSCFILYLSVIQIRVRCGICLLPRTCVWFFSLCMPASARWKKFIFATIYLSVIYLRDTLPSEYFTRFAILTDFHFYGFVRDWHEQCVSIGLAYANILNHFIWRTCRVKCFHFFRPIVKLTSPYVSRIQQTRISQKWRLRVRCNLKVPTYTFDAKKKSKREIEVPGCCDDYVNVKSYRDLFLRLRCTYTCFAFYRFSSTKFASSLKTFYNVKLALCRLKYFIICSTRARRIKYSICRTLSA